MPARDSYNIPDTLHRTMCPKCENDTHFIVPVRWNARSYEGWSENPYQRFVRHSKPQEPSEIAHYSKMILNDDTIIQCGDCGNSFTYLDGRQAYADQEQESIETAIAPSINPLPHPTIRVSQDDSYHVSDSRIYVPVAAYDLVHEGGIGNRGIAAYTSVITLSVPFCTSYGDAKWLIDLPEVNNVGHRHGRSEADSVIDIESLEDISVPISLSPEHLMGAIRSMYKHHAYARSYSTDISYNKEQDENGQSNAIEISINEANKIINLLKNLQHIGRKADEIKKSMSDNHYPYQILIDKNENFFMQVPEKAGRIQKTIAKHINMPLVELNESIIGGNEWQWERIARKMPNILNFYGAVPCHFNR